MFCIISLVHVFVFLNCSNYWDVTPYGPLKISPRLWGTCHFHLHSIVCWQLHSGFLLALFLGPEDGGDMFSRHGCWLPTDYTTLYPQYITLHKHHCENLRSCIFMFHSNLIQFYLIIIIIIIIIIIVFVAGGVAVIGQSWGARSRSSGHDTTRTTLPALYLVQGLLLCSLHHATDPCPEICKCIPRSFALFLLSPILIFSICITQVEITSVM
jgi:hypothetical protein